MTKIAGEKVWGHQFSLELTNKKFNHNMAEHRNIKYLDQLFEEIDGSAVGTEWQTYKYRRISLTVSYELMNRIVLLDTQMEM